MYQAVYSIVRLLQTFERIECRGTREFIPELRLSLGHKGGVLVAFDPPAS